MPERKRTTTHQVSVKIDPNAMDTSATVRKAATEADKQKHHKEGRCFECSLKGHLTRNCPTKQNKARKASSSEDKIEKAMGPDPSKGEDLTQFAFQLSDKERDAFMKRITSMGEEMGFLDA